MVSNVDPEYLKKQKAALVRRHRQVIYLNDSEIAAINQYCEKFRVGTKSVLYRKAIMEKVLKIDGMMCPHCERRVKKTLEALPQVQEAQVNWQEGTAVVTLQEKVDDSILKKAVEDQDYPVINIV